jgi:hypothetical protein
MTTTAPSVEEALVVHHFPSGERGEVRAYLQYYEGELLAHLRRYERRRDGQYVPTRKGIALRPHELSDLLIAVAMLVAAEGQDGASTS